MYYLLFKYFYLHFVHLNFRRSTALTPSRPTSTSAKPPKPRNSSPPTESSSPEVPPDLRHRKLNWNKFWMQFKIEIRKRKGFRCWSGLESTLTTFPILSEQMLSLSDRISRKAVVGKTESTNIELKNFWKPFNHSEPKGRMWIRVKSACRCEIWLQLWKVLPIWQFTIQNNKHFQKHNYYLKFYIPILFCFVFQNFFDRKWIHRLDFDFYSGAPTSIPSSGFQNSNPSQGW